MNVTVTGAVAAVLAQAPPGPERGEEFGKTSPMALVVILLLGLVTVLLIRSMGKHLRKVPASFDDPPATQPAEGEDAADGKEQTAASDGSQRDATPPDRS